MRIPGRMDMDENEVRLAGEDADRDKLQYLLEFLLVEDSKDQSRHLNGGQDGGPFPLSPGPAVL